MPEVSFPAAIPEIPVRDVAASADYYQRSLGFTLTGAARSSGWRASRREVAGCSSRAGSIARDTATLDPR
jgi:hypothetical protein